MADGRIVIETELDTGNIKGDIDRVNQELNQIGKTVPKNAGRMVDAFGNELDSLGRRIRQTYQGTSREAQAMSQEMQSAFRAQNMAMRGSRDEMIKIQHGYFKMAQGAKTYTGSSKQFMAGVTAMGARHKSVMDNMMKDNELAKMSFFQSVGQMVNRSTQASKISDNFTRMKNPMYSVNKGALAVADGLNKIALRGQPAVLALKMLGPTANMKQLRDMTTMISQGLMRFQMVALIAAASAAVFYSALHKGAMATSKAYAEAFKGMGASVRQAFQPLVDVFAMVMTPVYNFIKAIADMVVKFNEAHPTIARVVAAVMMLVPALTLILSPLAIGIGLFGGFSAAMGALWMIIGPVVTGFAAMMGTVWLVAAAIVALVVGIRYLWKTNEGFRAAVIAAWNAIKAGAMAVFNFLKPYIMQAMTAVTTFVQQKLAEMKQFWAQNGTQIMAALSVVWAGIKSIVAAGMAVLGPILTVGFAIIKAIVVSTWNAIKNVINGALNIIKGIIQVFSGLFTADFRMMWEGIKNIFKGALELIWGVINLYFIGKLIAPIRAFGGLAKTAVTGAWNGMKAAITTAMASIRAGITSAWNGIRSTMTAALNSIKSNVLNSFNAMKNVISSVMNGVKSVISTTWNAAKQLVITAANAMKNNVTNVFNGMKAVITGVMGAIKSVIQAQWNAAKAIVQGVVSAIKAIVRGDFNALKGIVATAMNGVKSAIVTGWNSAKAFLEGIDLSSIGRNIISGLASGITQQMGEAVRAVQNVGESIMGAARKVFDTHSPSKRMEKEVGRQLPAGIAVGVNANTRPAMKAMQNLGNEMMMRTPRNFASSMAKNGSMARPSSAPQTQMINNTIMLDSQVIGNAVTPIVNNRQNVQANFKTYMQGGKN